jgi:hypothetical protein
LNLFQRCFSPTLLTCVLAGSSTSWALGLGDIRLQSYLGQPLAASIDLIAGPEEEIDEKCFEVKPGADAGLPNVEGVTITLQKSRDRTRLLLTSRRPINDPAVAINVTTDCPQRLARQYLVLIDPPQTADLPVASATSPEAVALAPLQPVATRPPEHQTPSLHKARRRKPSFPAREQRPSRRAHTTKSGPRLILSGHRSGIADIGSFDLRMDMGLPEPGRYKDIPPNPTELSDENASLNHKLAYLEQQLSNLQRRNAELERKEALHLPAAKPSIADDTHSWLWWLLAFALLATGALLATPRWRNKRQAIPPNAEKELWSAPTTVVKPAPAGEVDALSATPDEPVSATSMPEKIVEPVSQPAVLPPSRTIKWAGEDGVEVDDSVVDEVEVFMAHGHADLAIDLLQEHVRTAPDESPIPWMLLLDLLKRNKMAKEYAESGKTCKQYFNIRVSDPYEDEPGPAAAGLEAYPHVLSELKRLWKSPECQAYLDDLIFDRRGGTRVGFDPPTFREIMLLRTIQMDGSQT